MKRIKELIREIIPVIIGILIALFINNWNDERKERKYLDKMFFSIEKELEEGILEIKSVIPQQMAFADTIQVYLNNDKVSLYDVMMKAEGVYSPVIKTNSWNAIANSKIELIGYERLSTLADIEERKKNLTNRVQRQTEYLFQNFEDTSKKKKEILKMMILDIIGAEKRLQYAIEEFIEENKYRK